MKQGEIWLVKFPEDMEGHEFKKERPAIIIESDLQLKKSNAFTILPLTSNINNCLAEDILLSPNNYNNLFTDFV